MTEKIKGRNGQDWMAGSLPRNPVPPLSFSLLFTPVYSDVPQLDLKISGFIKSQMKITTYFQTFPHQMKVGYRADWPFTLGKLFHISLSHL